MHQSIPIPAKFDKSVGYLFPGVKERMPVQNDPARVVAAMDEHGIDKALLLMYSTDPQPGIDALEKFPDRLYGCLNVDPHLGMEEVRRLDSLVRNHNIKAAKLRPHQILKPYNDKIYYPIYSKCIELDLPITGNVGIPGPLVPGASQDPMPLDEVCWFFPELKFVMTHFGEPWQALCIKLMLKWEGLYMMTSAFAPKHYPQEFIHYMNTRGADKVMFATDYPLIPYDRVVREIDDLPLRDHVWEKFLRGNAQRVFGL